MINSAFTASPGRDLGWVPDWAPALLLLVSLLLIGSAGYVGGGGDDWYYLEAARCMVHHGWCTPETHWASRWPLVAPLAGALAVFGESHMSVALVPLTYTVAATILLAANVRRRFGRPAAMLAAVAIVLTPAFFTPALQPAVDVPEFAWVLAALLAGQVALERRDARLAALSGAALGLAILTRASALAFILPLGLAWLALPASRRALAVPMGAAALAILAVDASLYALLAGDPLLGWTLSLHHTAIPSSELAPGVDLTRSALLNLDFIRHWRRSMGIEVHWTIDPLLNLLADPRSGLTLIGAVFLALVGRKALAAHDRRRWLCWATGMGVLHFLLLTFVFAINPKPRMFLFELGVAAATIGVAGSLAWREARSLLVVVLLALMVLRAALTSYDVVDLKAVQATAQRWALTGRGRVAVDEWTRRTLALVPAVQALPTADHRPTLPVLGLATQSCANAGETSGPHGATLHEVRFPRQDSAPLRWMRSHHLALGRQTVPVLCLFKPLPSN